MPRQFIIVYGRHSPIQFLCDLKVENLIIPSAVETCDMWKRKYNFTEMSEELKKEISSYNIVMFPCAVRLYKDLSASIAGKSFSLSLSYSPSLLCS